ncbi:MAG: MaoC family dehydratase N-terminal domain-containing protein [Clostridia bacterium]|nr:MaoC family dehydratase N-terminal domain-containing protein [Clostridia bacterium]
MFFEEIQLGAVYNLAPVHIKKEQILSFARDYDYIPLHTDEEYARQTRFGGLIAPGVMSFMLVWTKFIDINLFGFELVAGKSTKMEWIKPVYPGDVLTGKAEITAKTKHGSKNGIVEVTVLAYNQRDELVLSDTTEVVVKCKPAE